MEDPSEEPKERNKGNEKKKTSSVIVNDMEKNLKNSIIQHVAFL